MFQRLLLLAAAVCLMLPDQTHAEWFPRMRRVANRNRSWPAPFLKPDRVSIRAPFATMVNNGWRTQNTLADEHFDSDSGSLNEAGELKVREILTFSPPEHRTVYVLRATEEDVTATRNRSVADLVARLQPESSAPLVSGTNIRPRGASADYINSISTRFNATIPDPRLPASTMSMGGAGGSGGGAGGGGGF